MRQILVRSYSVTHPAGGFRLPTDTGWDQIIHAVRGVVRLETNEGGISVLPPDRASWVPAGTEHSCTVTEGTAMRTLYLRRDLGVSNPANEIRVWSLTPLARHVIAHLVDIAPRYDDRVTRAWLVVLAEVTADLGILPVHLPAPADPACQAAADLMTTQLAAPWTVSDLAEAVGVSPRTLTRRFHDDTGLTVGQWRTRLRLVTALEALAAGTPVGRVAVDVGYSTQSAFGAMFKRHLHSPPGAWRPSKC